LNVLINSWYSSIPAHPLIPSSSKAKSFVDACERVRNGTKGDDKKLREQQWEELKGYVEWMRANAGKKD
jgi:hypothetical protein